LEPDTAEVHQNLPEYQLKAAPESMALFLSAVKQEYGFDGRMASGSGYGR